MELMVEGKHVDELGHVNNAAYLVFAEAAAKGHADYVGLAHEAMAAMDRAFVVRRHEAIYYKEAFLGDCLELGTWVHSFSGPRCVREVDIRREGQLIFHSSTDWVWIDIRERVPKRLPADVIALFTD